MWLLSHTELLPDVVEVSRVGGEKTLLAEEWER
jgi:hypothetical protein